MVKISIFMTERTMASRKYDGKKQFKFQLYKYVIIIINQFRVYLHAYVTVQGPIKNSKVYGPL
jgi:hypothetical protein